MMIAFVCAGERHIFPRKSFKKRYVDHFSVLATFPTAASFAASFSLVL